MSFFIRVKSVTVSSSSDLRKTYNSAYHNINLTNEFANTTYDEVTVEYGKDSVGGWLGVNNMNAAFNMGASYDDSWICCNSQDMTPTILSDGRKLGEIVQYIIDPDNSGICRCGNLKITFSNDNYITLTVTASTGNLYYDAASNIFPCLKFSYLRLYSKDGTQLGVMQVQSSSTKKYFTESNKLISSGQYVNYTALTEGFYLFNLTPEFSNISSAQELSDTYKNLVVDYNPTSNSGSIKAPVIPLVRYMYLNSNMQGATFQTSRETIWNVTSMSPGVTNMPVYLNNKLSGSQYLCDVIRGHDDVDWIDANSSLSTSDIGSANNKGIDGWFYPVVSKNTYSNNIFILQSTYSSDAQKLANFFDGMESSTVPYDPGGFGEDSTTGGGGGDFDNTSEDVDFPSIPSLSAVATGFTSIYNPSPSDLKNLSDKFWDINVYEQLKQLWANPMDAIIGLNISFAPMPSSSNVNVWLGNYNTEITMPKLSSQYTRLDCGSINVKEYWGNFLDYTQTSCYIYLPFIGIEELSIKDVMNSTIRVIYNIDVLSGTCVANIKCSKGDLDSVLYSFNGNCNIPIPFSRNDFSSFYSGVYNMGVGVVNSAKSELNGSLGSTLTGSLDSIGNFIFSPKASVQRSGGIGSSVGALSIKRPYLILTRPKQQKPKNYEKYYGLTSHITKQLSDCKGFTKISSVHLDGVSATDEEKNMIMNQLTSGVFL